MQLQNDGPLLIRQINRHLNRDEIDEMNDQGVESFKQLEEFLKIFIPEALPSSVPHSQLGVGEPPLNAN